VHIKLFCHSNSSSSRTSRLSEVLVEDYEQREPTQLCCRQLFVAVLTLQDVDAQGRLSLRIQQHKASALRG
jgi:hypothetical protein